MLIFKCILIGIVIAGIVQSVFQTAYSYLNQFVKNKYCPECLTSCTQEELDVFGGVCEQCAAEEHDRSPLFLPGDRLIQTS